MLNFDRIVIVVLALGVWTLVLAPQGSHSHPNDVHFCSISGIAVGEVLDDEDWRGASVFVENWNAVSVTCDHHK